MPLAPPVTTTTFPATRMVNVLGQNQIEHGGIMAGRAQQHETMPDHVLEAKPLPAVKDHPKTVKRATCEHEPEREAGQRRHHGIIEHSAAPAHRQINADRDAVITTRQRQLEHDAYYGHAP